MVSQGSQALTSPSQSFQDQKRWRKEEGFRMHTPLHPNFQRLRQCSFTSILENQNPGPAPPPTFSAPPPAASPVLPPPPITASLWAPRRIPARNCCSQLSSASPGSCSLCPGSAAPAVLRTVPFPFPTPPPSWHNPWLRA